MRHHLLPVLFALSLVACDHKGATPQGHENIMGCRDGQITHVAEGPIGADHGVAEFKACGEGRCVAMGETCPPSTPNADPKGETRGPANDKCLASWSIDHNSSVLQEQRSVGPHVDDFHEQYAAANIDPDTFAPVKAVERFQIGNTALLWFTADRSQAVVNAAVLSDLKVVDITRMSPGDDKVVIGTLTELGKGKIEGRTLLEFLVRARVIGTYIHIGSELCLVSERESHDGHEGKDGYLAHVEGEHTYFTNEKNVKPVAFDFSIDAGGELVVAMPSAAPR